LLNFDKDKIASAWPMPPRPSARGWLSAHFWRVQGGRGGFPCDKGLKLREFSPGELPMLTEESRLAAETSELEPLGVLDFARLERVVDDVAALHKKSFMEEGKELHEAFLQKLPESNLTKFYILKLILRKYWKDYEICADLFRHIRWMDERSWPWGFELAEIGLTHPEADVRHEAMGALENWDNSETREALRKHLPRETYKAFAESIKQYLNYKEKGGADGILCA
jgi:hypothetical protein